MATIHALLITTKINQPVKIKFRYKEKKKRMNDLIILWEQSVALAGNGSRLGEVEIGRAHV